MRQYPLWSAHHCFRLKWHVPYLRLSSRVGRTALSQPNRTFCSYGDSRLSSLGQAPQRLLSDSIYALSTAPGRAAIAVIRISGPACLDIYCGLCPGRPFPYPRIACLRKLYHPQSSQHPDESQLLDAAALVLFFPAPKTATGEDILELHLHGGPALVTSVLEAIPACQSFGRERKRAVQYSLVRPAEAGEFTKRAFYHGRLDLTQVDSLGDVLTAETEQQRRLALRGQESGLASRYNEWQKMLLYARGELEALIDFSEDQHFDESPQQLVAGITQQVGALHHQIGLHLSNASKGELMRSGISIALLGAPNAGKSSLLNRVVGREAAIVSSEEGTTRDIVDVSIDIGGWLVRLGDMAGLRGQRSEAGHNSRSEARSVGAVEAEGIRRARVRALESDVVIVLLSVEQTMEGGTVVAVNEKLEDAIKDCQTAGKQIVVAINKIDLLKTSWSACLDEVAQRFPAVPSDSIFLISCKAESASFVPQDADQGNIQNFLRGLTSVFEDMTAVTSDAAAATLPPGLSPAEAQSYWSASLSISHRQSAHLKQCRRHLGDFLEQATPRHPDQTMSAIIETLSNYHTDGQADLVGQIEDVPVDIVALAEDLRFAASCLARITGRGEGGDVEDVLGVVFEK